MLMRGSMRKESTAVPKYFIVLVVDASRWCEVRFPRFKAEIFDKTREVIKLMESQTGRSQCMQFDNGNEFVNKMFDI